MDLYIGIDKKMIADWTSEKQGIKLWTEVTEDIVANVMKLLAE
jgi:hypothetical protein